MLQITILKLSGFFMAMALFVCFLYVPQALAGDYLGEVCWWYQQTENEEGGEIDDPVLVRLGLTHAGGCYFTCQGYVEVPKGEDYPIIGGSGAILGNELFLSIQVTHDILIENDRSSELGQARISLSNLDGSLWMIRQVFNTEKRNFDNIYAFGTLKYTTCP
jgi:hypothetical protein